VKRIDLVGVFRLRKLMQGPTCLDMEESSRDREVKVESVVEGSRETSEPELEASRRADQTAVIQKRGRIRSDLGRKKGS